MYMYSFVLLLTVSHRHIEIHFQSFHNKFLSVEKNLEKAEKENADWREWLITEKVTSVFLISITTILVVENRKSILPSINDSMN